MITVVASRFNNQGSLFHSLRRVGAEFRVAETVEDIRSAQAILLPGVGAFGAMMARLREQGFANELVHHALMLQKPIAGICLGMQVLLDGSEEFGQEKGLGLIGGMAKPLISDHARDRVPRLGWSEVRGNGTFHDFPCLRDTRDFYFAHSYHAVCNEDGSVVATTPFNNKEIVAVIANKNVVGCQFHPEKSQDAGLNFLTDLIRFLLKGTSMNYAKL